MTHRNYFISLCVSILLLGLAACAKSPDRGILPSLEANLPAEIVYISDDACPSVTVQAGHSLDFINGGLRAHIVRTDLLPDGSRLIDSGPLEFSDAIIVTFPEPAVIPYECSEDGSLQGTITVAP